MMGPAELQKRNGNVGDTPSSLEPPGTRSTPQDHAAYTQARRVPRSTSPEVVFESTRTASTAANLDPPRRGQAKPAHRSTAQKSNAATVRKGSGKHVELDTLERYHSSSPSLRPEARRPAAHRIRMPLKRFAFLGAVRPTNNLTTGTHDTLRPSPVNSSSPQRPVTPSAKRQKLDSGRFASSTIEPSNESSPDHPQPRRKSDASVSLSEVTLTSARSSSHKTNSTNVNEYRNVHKAVSSGGKKRTRKKTSAPSGHSSQTNAESRYPKPSRDPETGLLQRITSDSDPEQLDLIAVAAKPVVEIRDEPTHGAEDGRHITQNYKAKPQSHSPSNLKRKAEETESALRKRLRDDSPDQLAGDVDSSDRLIRPPLSRKLPPSPSVSQRGAIQRSAFVGRPKGTAHRDLTRARNIIGQGLRVLNGVSGAYGYSAGQADSENQAVLLQVGQVSHILQPMGDDGTELPQYAYLMVNLKKLRRYRLANASGNRFIAIERSQDPGNSASPKLHLEFSAPEDAQSLVRWIQLDRFDEPRMFSPQECDEEILRKELNNLLSQARHTTTIRDTGSLEQEAVDIQLMQHNLAARESRSQSERVTATRSKVKDLMRPVDSISPNGSNLANTKEPAMGERRALRRHTNSRFTQETSPSIEPPRWTEEHKDWDKSWSKSLVYPSQGRNRATVDKEDVQRLDEGQFLNDNLIIFYLRYLQQNLETTKPELAKRVYFHNTFFYEKLKPLKAGGDINYDSVKAWTSKVDLFTKDYIIVPINEFSHWYVAIICNASKLLPSAGDAKLTDQIAETGVTIEVDNQLQGGETGPIAISHPDGEPPTSPRDRVVSDLSHMSIEDSDSRKDETSTKEAETRRPDDTKVDSPKPKTIQKKAGKRMSLGLRKHDPTQPKIITLDSLGGTHSPACSSLRKYLLAELRDKKGVRIDDPGAMGMTAKNVPLQSNHCDCGLFLLGYIEKFLNDPDSTSRNILQYENVDWNFSPSQLRQQIRELILKLHNDQLIVDAQLKQEKQARRNAAIAKKESVSASSPKDEAGNEIPADGHPASRSGTPPARDSTGEDDPAAKENVDVSRRVVNASVLCQRSPQKSSPTSKVIDTVSTISGAPEAEKADTSATPVSKSDMPTNSLYEQTQDVPTEEVAASITAIYHEPSLQEPKVSSSKSASPARSRGRPRRDATREGSVPTKNQPVGLEGEDKSSPTTPSRRYTQTRQSAAELPGNKPEPGGSTIEVYIEARPVTDSTRKLASPKRRKETIVKSPHFANLKPGESVISARLHESSTEPVVVEDSDD